MLLVASIVVPAAARGGAKLSFYGVHMDPAGQDAQRFSHASFGAGVHTSASVPQLGNALVIAHRLSTIQNVDRIIVLHHGQIREVGTHAELLERRGIYHRLYQLQYFGDRAAKAAVRRDEWTDAEAPAIDSRLDFG